MNFHLKDGIYFRSDGGKLKIIKATSFEDPGDILAEMTMSEFCSIVSSASPYQERNGSFNYIHEFLVNGTMFCGGCGVRLKPEDWIGGWLSVINLLACKPCYEGKFKPLFDWGMKAQVNG